MQSNASYVSEMQTEISADYFVMNRVKKEQHVHQINFELLHLIQHHLPYRKALHPYTNHAYYSIPGAALPFPLHIGIHIPLSIYTTTVI